MSTKKIEVIVDQSKCLGYGICLGLPEVFDIPEGSSVAVVNQRFFDEALMTDIEATAKDCPAGAIQFFIRDADEAAEGAA